MGHGNTSERKKDHIELAFQSHVSEQEGRFYYEPLFKPHPKELPFKLQMADAEMTAPIWISSMTGGTKEAGTINKNLARAAGEYGLGMGLGSCRIILDDDTYLKDFQLRKWAGNAPLYANLGIAQLEELLSSGMKKKVIELIEKTETNGLIIHVNPLQEWLQPEGDRFLNSPINTIEALLDLDISLIVKEVGQGFGPKSMKALMNLPLTAIDFGAHGGTNFSKLELNRATDLRHEAYVQLASWGHNAEEMVDFYNSLSEEIGASNQTQNVIISGGVKHFVDGYFLIEKISSPAVYGQASPFLKHARGSYEELKQHVELQIEGLKMAYNYLTIRP